MSSHTKKWDVRAVYWLLRYARKHDGPWGEVDTDDGYGPDDLPQEEDAKLICAAPQLLEACENLLRRMSVGEMCEGECRPGVDEHVPTCIEGIARSAIAAAEGKKP